MWKILEPMRADFEFTSKAAAEVNSLLEVPLLRAGSFMPDRLLSTPGDLEATAQCPSNVIELTIQTWLPLQVELIGLKMHHDGAGHNCTLGSHKVVSEMLNLWVTCIETPNRELIYNPKVSHKFAPGEILWCQLKGSICHKKVALVISKEASEHKILADHTILVDHRLTGSQQYLLLPAVKRTWAGGIATPYVHRICTMTELNMSDDVSQTTSTNIKTFFQGNNGEMSVSLQSHPVQIIDTEITSGFHKRGEELVPLALCGQEAIAKLKAGITSKQNSDFHGAHPRDDVQHHVDTPTLETLRDMGTLVGFRHIQTPRVYHLPKDNLIVDEFGCGCFWESPPSSSTVINHDSQWIMLLKENKPPRDGTSSVSPGSQPDVKEAALAQTCGATQQMPVHEFLPPHKQKEESYAFFEN